MTVQDIRSFNRFYTNLIGALDYGRHLYAPYTLTESRVLYELAHSPRTDAADLRTELHLDAGYLSRILNKFEQDGLIERAPSERDPRRRRITLTARGREAADLLDERARETVGALVAHVPPEERGRLAEALRTVRAILGAERAPRPEDVVLREPGPGDLGWIVQRNAALYAAEYGWNTDYEGLVARIVADFAEDHDPHLERVWIAELDGRPVGCVMCVRDEAPATARLRLLLVEPDARGLGIGDRLVRSVIDFARGVGYRDLVLWTNDVLTAARRVYQRHGFVLVAEKPHRSFGKDLVGQDWRVNLRGTPE
ncbi:bifunctional helix-turn-helix transcriptional regulator/GNAT family N-acetyltransferase [Streptomyces spinoverrucosus]|uniref:bifunctional helix-turn-helix transcriptional regulator/GNAT family N-acetyltransferase n=1 Tax=Streptomyces spinoverrucosus TaxID=284043 RepID=UPI0018C43A09|nr:bifunctional helix-turn-helix transcriptional regulator/GNAT family N-acetyltransferase [Streptomyces spinoverrucosus]MBG0855108.1 bifunctional helix-turn-helix transcriptional regulator/GNAT family N-acetyltransferase [Streptomyces spinoverrucosus]